MKIKKKDGDFNSYAIEDVSYGELVAMEKAMSTQHGDPLSDEVYATIKWYLDELPKPGEEKEDEDEEGKGGEGVDDADFDHAPDDSAAGPEEDPAPEDEDEGGAKGDGDDDRDPPNREPESLSGTEKGGESADDYLEAPPE